MKMRWEFFHSNFEIDNSNPFLRISPWATNRIFAYDLVSNLKPKTVVELGTHYGCSLSAFAQAIKDQKLSTVLYGVDTWKGDEQAGFYGEEIIEELQKNIRKHYKKVDICLVRKFFDDAVNDFKDESVDIIHLDGLHTYKATKNDYNKWVGKLKKDGIFLFHDMGERAKKAGYGSVDLWKELKKKYSYFEFLHEWGLGVLFPRGDGLYKKMMAIDFDKMRDYYEYRQRYELEKIKTYDLEHLVIEKDKGIQFQTKLINERDQYIEKLKEKILSV